MDKDEKVRENRARRAAVRQGLILQRARVRDPRATLFGTYQLADPKTGKPARNLPGWGPGAATADGYGFTLEQIEQALDAKRPLRQTYQTDDHPGA